MHFLQFLDGSLRRTLRLADRMLVPLSNRELHRVATREPSDLRRRLDRAIVLAIGYFNGKPGLEMPTLIALLPLYASGMEPRLAFVSHWLEAYRGRFNDPDLRVLMPEYDADARSDPSLLRIGPTHPINVLMTRCTYADRLGLGDEILEELAALEDGGGYGTTHVLWGGLLLKAFSHLSQARIDSLIEQSIAPLLLAQRRSRFEDLFAERMLFLQWIGRHDLVNPAWAERLLRAQRKDGGWKRLPTILPATSNQHTSCMALAALIHVRHFLYPTNPPKLVLGRMSPAAPPLRPVGCLNGEVGTAVMLAPQHLPEPEATALRRRLE